MDEVNETSFKDLCDLYGLDSTIVARELYEFRVAYRSFHSLVGLTDLQASSAWTDSRNPALYDTNPATGEQFDDRAEEEDDDDGENTDKGSPVYRNIAMHDFEKWTDYSFVKSLRVIYQLTSNPSLTTMYTMLASLAVTSCSAEW